MGQDMVNKPVSDSGFLLSINTYLGPIVAEETVAVSWLLQSGYQRLTRIDQSCL